ncbi:MAG: hypothetical protein RLZZ262_1135 [Bacteroidota bacterium]|jgi:O-antigen/teichoic acid export membrane protein
MSVTSKFSSGLSWNTLTVVLQVLIQLVYTGLFARMVDPTAFMLMGLVLGIMGFAEIFSQVGVGPALIQRKDIHQQHINGAFYTALLLGLFFSSAFVFGASTIADFYQLPELKPLTQMVCTSFTISALAVVPRSMMMKEMRFKTMFKASMISIIGGNLIVGLTLAYLGFGVWAYAWALFAQNALMTLALWYFQPVPVTRSWQWKYTAELMRYGIGSTLFNSLNYLATKLDVMIIPRFMTQAGAAPNIAQINSAAQYERANYAMSQPITIMGKLSDSVLFSGMAAMQDNTLQLRRTFLIATNLLGLAMWSLAGFIFFFSQPLILFWLGDRYVEAGQILQVLFFVAVLRTLSKLCDSLFRAKDHLMFGSVIKGVYVTSILIAIWLTIDHGMMTVAWAVVAATGLHYLLNIVLTMRILEISFISIVRSWLPSWILGLCSACWAGITWLVLSKLIEQQFIVLIVGVSVWSIGMLTLVYLYPWLLGGQHINPLYMIPQKIKNFSILQKLINRLPKKA